MVEKLSYAKQGKTYISPNFQAYEFASIGDNGKLYTDVILYDTIIVGTLERLFPYLGCSMIRINSGYRSQEHEMSLKNSAINGWHTKGRAVDINCYKNGKVIKAKDIALALEDLGATGIGLISANAIHLDTRDSKYYFNEQNGNKSIGNSFYTYYGVKSPKQKVIEQYGLAEETVDYLMEYKYGAELLKNLLNTHIVVKDGGTFDNVKNTFGFADETMKYLIQYLYGNELLEKLLIGVKDGK